MGRPKLGVDREVQCAWCGRRFVVTIRPSEKSKRSGRFCSRTCHYAWRGRPAEQKFWESLTKVHDGCWLWCGFRDRDGYGFVALNARKSVRAHRFSYELHYGPIPAGAQVLHRCDVPACVNPGHLFLGSQRDNVHDMRKKGRISRGAARPAAKLTEAAVRTIRDRYAAGCSTQVQLAAEYGVSRDTVYKIIHRKAWHHVA